MYLLACAITLENLFEVAFGFDTPFNAYRILAILICVVLTFKNGLKAFRINRVNSLIFLVFFWGALVALVRYYSKDVEFNLLAVNFLLFVINFLMFISLYNTSMNVG